MSGTVTSLPANIDYQEVIDRATEQGVLSVCFGSVEASGIFKDSIRGT